MKSFFESEEELSLFGSIHPKFQPLIESFSQITFDSLCSSFLCYVVVTLAPFFTFPLLSFQATNGLLSSASFFPCFFRWVVVVWGYKKWTSQHLLFMCLFFSEGESNGINLYFHFPPLGKEEERQREREREKKAGGETIDFCTAPMGRESGGVREEEEEAFFLFYPASPYLIPLKTRSLGSLPSPVSVVFHVPLMQKCTTQFISRRKSIKWEEDRMLWKTGEEMDAFKFSLLFFAPVSFWLDDNSFGIVKRHNEEEKEADAGNCFLFFSFSLSLHPLFSHFLSLSSCSFGSLWISSSSSETIPSSPPRRKYFMGHSEAHLLLPWRAVGLVASAAF